MGDCVAWGNEEKVENDVGYYQDLVREMLQGIHEEHTALMVEGKDKKFMVDGGSFDSPRRDSMDLAVEIHDAVPGNLDDMASADAAPIQVCQIRRSVSQYPYLSCLGLVC